jgi:glycosyltransferase involved in cell wall biosynthesis
VIVPTFNNVKNNRFLWNLESILQQEYSNLKVVIIDDGSTDNTTARIAKHLSWKNAPKDRFTLIKSSRRNKSLMSFYYGAHKYCGLGEIIYTIDGDDELIGTQVFKLINAIYQQEKVYTLYTTYINKSMKQLRLGYNQNYDLETVNSNSYRQDKSHAYSHLRTMMSDTFLLVNSSSLRDKDGKFYEMITDNAVYFCALELSCKRVRNL